MRYVKQQLRTKIINQSWKLLLGLFAITFYSCNSRNDNTHITDSFLLYQKIDSLKIQDYNLIEQDCSFIAEKHYRFSVFKNDSACFFQVEKLEDNHWHLIMRDMDYGTNNSGLSFTDQNKDGFEDIVWNKK